MPRRRPLALVLVIALAAAVLLGACSDDDDGAGEMLPAESAPFVEAMVDQLRSPDNDIEYTPEEAQCVSERWVAIVGVDRLDAAGIDPDAFAIDSWSGIEFTDEELDAIAEAPGECGIDMRQRFLDDLLRDATSDEQAACLEEVVTDDLVAEFVKASATGALSDAEMAELVGPITSCQELTESSGD